MLSKKEVERRRKKSIRCFPRCVLASHEAHDVTTTTTRRKINRKETRAFPPRNSALALARVNSREEGARVIVSLPLVVECVFFLMIFREIFSSSFFFLILLLLLLPFSIFSFFSKISHETTLHFFLSSFISFDERG